MNTKTLVGLGVGVLVLMAGAFYGGMVYGKSTIPVRGQDRGQFTAGPNGARGTGTRSGTNGGGFAVGETLSKDDTSLTIKMQDGNTKIVLYSGSTMVTKSASGTPADIKNGEQVMVQGISNPDGSMTAEIITIGGVRRRPN